jgi:phosphoribosylformylglycinamidine cyclo-ligase
LPAAWDVTVTDPNNTPEKGGLSYRDAGVDIDAMNSALGEIRQLAKSTQTPGVLAGIGGFGGLFSASGFDEPVMVASVDGVGTKLRVALEAGVHDTIGADLVNHCIDDILVQGAVPLFFMDYFATGGLETKVLVDVVRGMSRACREADCALLGGETAEMPGFYPPGDYDVAGFIVGMVERKRLITGAAIRPGDRLLGLSSRGLHTHGYSLARKILFEVRGLDIHDPLPGVGATAAEALLAVHRCYLPVLRDLVSAGRIQGMAHITGGGFVENLPRVLPADCDARIQRGAWMVPELFKLLAEWGGVAREEMERTFNMGIGMILMVRPDDADSVTEHLHGLGETVHAMGEIEAGSGRVRMSGDHA